MATVKRVGLVTGWIMVSLTILVLVVFATIRALDMFGDGASSQGLFDVRYLEHPVVASIHMVTGIAFLMLAPLQFSPTIRNQYRSFHRIMGRALLVCALIAGIYGVVSAIVLPVFGGIASVAAVWFFGPMFIFMLLRAFWCIRKRKIAQHREWMIRTFALGLGVGTQRVALGLMAAFGHIPIIESFGTALWLGFGINLIIAEIWINVSRLKSN